MFKYYTRLEASSGWSYVLQARGHDWTLTKDGIEVLDIGVHYYEHDGGTVNVRLPDGSHLYVPQQSTSSVSGDVPVLVSPRGIKKMISTSLPGASAIRLTLSTGGGCEDLAG